ncbi:hypothetical protein HFV04_023050 [Pseudomonas sp. BIGb0427]|uniref:hypothetical protein n=1 Tax=unclassified Pseudomonas TaxID=196821 RepID=UPI0018A6F9A2|nr:MULTISPECIES: hypothetical protein [unclassified Pseudomonas]QPG62375.1 hypothetical protein HFV04_023050 [Pseudomonas sp. BIGb0427]UVM64722.1 hypothetical protein LOY34_15330 [Pseudomonas sp. B21-009]
MENLDNKKAYQLADDLLRTIKDGTEAKLESAGITPAIYEEIAEELERSGENVSDLRLPPFDVAFTPDSTGRVPFDIFRTDAEPCSLRISCQLWGHDKCSELTLIADCPVEQRASTLTFRLLETQ